MEIRVADYTFADRPAIRKGIGDIMGGKVLELEPLFYRRNQCNNRSAHEGCRRSEIREQNNDRKKLSGERITWELLFCR